MWHIHNIKIYMYIVARKQSYVVNKRKNSHSGQEARRKIMRHNLTNTSLTVCPTYSIAS